MMEGLYIVRCAVWGSAAEYRRALDQAKASGETREEQEKRRSQKWDRIMEAGGG